MPRECSSRSQETRQNEARGEIWVETTETETAPFGTSFKVVESPDVERPDVGASAVNRLNGGSRCGKDAALLQDDTTPANRGSLWKHSPLHPSALAKELEARSKEVKTKVKVKTKRALNGTPTAVALLVVFPILIGIMMTWVAPLFVIYRDKGVAANSAQFQGWVGCSPPASAAASSNTPPVRRLVQYRGIAPNNIGSDFEEATLQVGPGKRVDPVAACPDPDSESRNAGLGVSNEPYARLIFTFSKINPDEVTTDVTIRVEVVNSLDTNNSSLLNTTSAELRIVITPAIPGQDEFKLKWANDASAERTGLQVLLSAVKPLTNYPWDLYTIDRGVKAEIVVFEPTMFPQTRVLPIQVFTQASTQLFDVWVSSQTNGTSRMLQGSTPDLPLHVEITRSKFTKGYAVLAVILIWLTGGLNFVHVMDNIFVRPRQVKDVVAPFLLWALPGFRATMPGVPAQMGLAIDMIGLVWAELLLAVCVVVSFVAFIGQYKHPAPLFKRLKAE